MHFQSCCRQDKKLGVHVQMTAPVDKTINEYADFWRYDIGVNVIPAETRKKLPLVKWAEWQDKPIPKELHGKWKSEKRIFERNCSHTW